MARAMEIYVYPFDELSEATQTKVIDNWRTDDTFFWADEWKDSLDAFVRHAPLKVKDYSIGYPGTYVTFEMDDDAVSDLSGVRAWKWLVNNGWDALANPGDGKSCPFTGYCGDENLLDAIRKALAYPSKITSLGSVFGDCLSDWAKAFEADYDHWYSEEAIREDIEANSYEFYDDGTLA